MRWKRYLKPAGLAVGVAGLAAAVAVPLALGNTGSPVTASASWHYVSGNSGAVQVTVSGNWNWEDQSCAQGGKPAPQHDMAGGKQPPPPPPPKGGKPSPPPAPPSSGPGGSSSSSGGTSQTYINGHMAVGIAGSWNDASTPYTITGKTTSGQTLTLHVGSTMDQLITNYCAGTTVSNPYPSGTYSISHEYPSLAAFRAAIPTGEVCVNA